MAPSARFEHLDLVLASEASASAKVVFVALWQRCSTKNHCWPAVEKIGDACGMKRRSTQRCLRELCDRGFIAIERPTGALKARMLRTYKADHMPNVYHLRGAHDMTPRGADRGARNDTPRGARNDANGAHEMTPKLLRGTAKKSSLQNSSRARDRSERDDLWDAVVEVFELPVKTRAQKSRIGRIVTELVSMDAKGEDVRVRAERLVTEWDGRFLTPESLVKHWQRFRDGTNNGRTGTGRAKHRPGKYSEIK